MSASLADLLIGALHRLLDVIYADSREIESLPIMLAVMYFWGLAALLATTGVLHWTVLYLRVLLRIAFQNHGRRGSLEATRLYARLYCSLERMLWSLDPGGLWARIFLQRQSYSWPVRIPLNITRHAFSLSISNALAWASILVSETAHPDAATVVRDL
jgi:hypothetical protein